jgi:hypothetical protein
VADIVIGLYSPYKYGIKDFEKYDITKLQDYVRFMEIIEDRGYGANGRICPLFFNGAASVFQELPKAENTAELNRVYSYINSLENKKINKLLMMFSRNKIKKQNNIT